MAEIKVNFIDDTCSKEAFEEGYSVSKAHNLHMITVKVLPSNVNHMFYRLARLIAGEGYLTIEVANSSVDPVVNDVYFWGGLGQSKLWDIYGKYGSILANNKWLSYGFASQNGDDEVYVDRLKTFRIFTSELQKYTKLLASLGYSSKKTVEAQDAECMLVKSDKDSGYLTEEPEVLGMLDDMQLGNLRFGKRYTYKSKSY